MRGFVNFVIRNKLAVWLLTIVVIFSGIYSGMRMKLETIPDINVPFLLVMDVYPGATAEQVMNEISIPMEKKIEDLDHVKAVYSTSYANFSGIQVEYEYGTDMDEAKRQLELALDDVPLPEEAEEPIITALSFDMMPVLVLSISSETEDIVELTSMVEEMILPNIEKIDGVAQAIVTGQHIDEVELVFDEEKLEALNLTEEDVKDFIKATDMEVSLGLFEFENAEEAVSVDGKLTTAKELKEMLIPVEPSETNPLPFVKLEDIAEVKEVGRAESISRTNGEEAIAIQIMKGQRANTVDVVNKVKDLMEKEKERIDGLIVDIPLDQGEPIEESVRAMVEKALYGGLIAVIIILLFLRDIRSTIISIISIPVSILMSLLLLDWLDMTLNIMTLGAITVAIGRVIDDSIVVVENIYRRLHLRGEKLWGRALIREATLQMFIPILSSTLVTVAVFAPLLFVGGMVGELFVPFALTMTFALLASLLVAVSIVPSLSHSLFKKRLYGKRDEKSFKDPGKIANWYKNALNWTLNHKIISSITALVLLMGSLGLVPLIGFSFLGSQEEKVMYLTYTPKPGELFEETVKHVTEVEEEFLKRDDIEILEVSITEETDPMTTLMGGGSDGALMFLTFDEDIDNFPEVKKEIEEYLANLDQSGEWKSQDFHSMGFSANELSYTFYSENLDRLQETVEMVAEVMEENEHLDDVSTSIDDVYIEHTFKVDQQDLLQYGLTTGQIVMALSPDTTKEVITTVKKDGNDIDVIVRHEERESFKDIDDLMELEVETPLGVTMKLKDLVTVEEGTTYNTLQRSQGTYYASVSAEILIDDIGKVTSEVDEAIEELELPKGVTSEIGGVAADMIETFTQLGVAMIAAILIVYFILVVTFGEGLAPFAILFSLPFTIIGSLVGLYLTDQTISVTVLMGLLMLIGIVVTNAIVLVDRIIRMEHSGMELREAILEAGMTRLRPILMTAIATMGALIPLAMGNGAGGGLISKDLAITVIGGLGSSTLLTLFVVPIVYEILSKLFKKNRKEIEEN